MLQEPLHQFLARVALLLRRRVRVARQQHLRFNVDQQRGHVDELRRHVHIQLLDALHVGEKLRGDFPDGNVVDINVLFADEIEKQVERPVVDLSHADREGKIAGGRRCHGLSAGLGWLCH